MFSDSELLRYSRHILLPSIDLEGQEKLSKSHILIVGCGGLGNYVASILAASGVGKITLVDFDTIELSNLQRQIIFKTHNIGQYKADILKSHLLAVNPEIEITSLISKINDLEPTYFKELSCILDCTDNFKTRQLINQIALMHQMPLITGSAVRFDGQLAVFDHRNRTSPCYACLFNGDDSSDGECATLGIFSPILSIIGGLQAQETLKLLLGLPFLTNTLLIYDGFNLNFDKIIFKKNPRCRICN